MLNSKTNSILVLVVVALLTTLPTQTYAQRSSTSIGAGLLDEVVQLDTYSDTITPSWYNYVLGQQGYVNEEGEESDFVKIMTGRQMGASFLADADTYAQDVFTQAYALDVVVETVKAVEEDPEGAAQDKAEEKADDTLGSFLQKGVEITGRKFGGKYGEELAGKAYEAVESTSEAISDDGDDEPSIMEEIRNNQADRRNRLINEAAEVLNKYYSQINGIYLELRNSFERIQNNPELYDEFVKNGGLQAIEKFNALLDKSRDYTHYEASHQYDYMKRQIEAGFKQTTLKVKLAQGSQGGSGGGGSGGGGGSNTPCLFCSQAQGPETNGTGDVWDPWETENPADVDYSTQAFNGFDNSSSSGGSNSGSSSSGGSSGGGSSSGGSSCVRVCATEIMGVCQSYVMSCS